MKYKSPVKRLTFFEVFMVWPVNVMPNFQVYIFKNIKDKHKKLTIVNVLCPLLKKRNIVFKRHIFGKTFLNKNAFQ